MAENTINNYITLIVSGENFVANKSVISEKSDYFKAMFSSGMIELKNNEVVLNGISSKGFRDILRYMHGLVVKLDMENVSDILATADYIQINDIMKFCKEFLMSNVDAKNCSTVANIAECYSFGGLKEHVLNFIDENIWDISQTETFNKLSPEQINHAVRADKMVKFSELDLLDAILQWGLKPSNITIKEKLKHVKDMLGHVRFYEISKTELNERLRIKFSENSAIHPIHEKITQLSILPCNSVRTKFSTRGLKKAILRVGGFGSVEKRSIVFNFINDTKWIKLTEIPNIDKHYKYYGSAVLNNELYVIGNSFTHGGYSFISKFSHKTNKWETTHPRNIMRTSFRVCEVDDKIFVVGGSIRAGQESSGVIEFEAPSTVESYDPMMETWVYIASLPQPREFHASVNFAKTLYISGGITNSRMVASMMKYNPLTNTWLSCAPLLSPRVGHTMITYGDKIYVCGGWDDQNRNIEEYDVAKDSWRFVTTVPGRLPIETAIFVESEIYVLADYFDTEASDNEFYEIDCYDVETKVWSKEIKEKKYSRNVWNYDCHTMYLPKSLADDR